jgi:cell division transport system permease protein
MLGKMPDVKSYTFVSKDEALVRMKKRYPDLTTNLTSNPLPASFEVKPVKAERVDEIAKAFDPPPPGVEKATYPKKETKRVLAFAKGLGIFFLIGSMLLLAASTLLIANTIRLSIFSRRREVEVMKLVGATNWFVRGPFMLEGLFCGLAGSVVAIALLLLAREFAPEFILRSFHTNGVSAWSFPLIALILLGVSLLVGAAGSGITLRRFLRI